MNLEHIAIWTHQLEALRTFYETYFGAQSNEKYVSDKDFNGTFSSYFLSFESGARLEIMSLSKIPQGDNKAGYESTGLTHIAFAAENLEELDILYARMKDDGVPVVGEPRWTGDGYYEACVLDPDGNRVEIAVTP